MGFHLKYCYQVMTHAQTSKFLIFSRSPLTLMYIAEALGLISVPYKLTTQKHVNALQADVLTFETSETFRVFLMELKHGARGLYVKAVWFRVYQ